MRFLLRAFSAWSRLRERMKEDPPRAKLRKLLLATGRKRPVDVFLVFALSVIFGAVVTATFVSGGTGARPAATNTTQRPVRPHAVVFAPLAARRAQLAKALQDQRIAGFTGRWNSDTAAPDTADTRTLAALRRLGQSTALLNLSRAGDLGAGVNCDSSLIVARETGERLGQQAHAAGYDMVLAPALNGCVEAREGLLTAFVQGLRASGIEPAVRGFDMEAQKPLQTELATLPILAIVRSRSATAVMKRSTMSPGASHAVLMADHEPPASEDPTDAAEAGVDAQLYEAGATAWATANAVIAHTLGPVRFQQAVRRVWTLPTQGDASGAP